MPVPGLSLPKPVPLQSSSSSSSTSKSKERKEVSLKIKPNKKVNADKQWEVEDDDEDEELNEALESVRKAVDTDSETSKKVFLFFFKIETCRVALKDSCNSAKALVVFSNVDENSPCLNCNFDQSKFD